MSQKAKCAKQVVYNVYVNRLYVDFTGVVSTVGGGGVLRKKTHTKTMLVVVVGDQYL